jgi:hypothetical protein
MKNYIVLILMIVISNNPLQAQKIDEKDVPASIVSAAKEKSDGQVVVTMWVRDKNRGKYIASIFNPPVFMMIEIDMKGDWLSTYHTMTEENFPSAVMKTIKDSYISKGYEADNFLFVEKPGLSFYMLDVSSDDENLQIKLDANGKIFEKKIR